MQPPQTFSGTSVRPLWSFWNTDPYGRGKLYSQFDPKLLYILTVTLFEAGSAICGAAPSMNALIVGRTIAGLGGAGMYLGVIMLLSFFTTPVERPKYIGMIGAVFGLGTV